VFVLFVLTAIILVVGFSWSFYQDASASSGTPDSAEGPLQGDVSVVPAAPAAQQPVPQESDPDSGGKDAVTMVDAPHSPGRQESDPPWKQPHA
jgi:hypothetical protein